MVTILLIYKVQQIQQYISYTKRFQWHTNTYKCGAEIETKCTIYFLFIYIFISWKKGEGSALNIFSIFYTHHRIPNEHMMTINFDTITNNYEVIYVIKTVMQYYFKKIDEFSSASFKMVQRLFADVIHDAIWFMNIHEQNHPWFLFP